MLAVLGAGLFFLLRGRNIPSEENQDVVTETEQVSYFSEYMRYETGTVSVYGKDIRVYLADDPRVRTRGLSNKTSLPEDEGMLFIFEESDTYSFWMKDMNFPIDMVWIDENKKVVFIKENATPESYPTLFTPTKSALYVLEVNAGYARELGLTVGTRVDIEL